MNIVKIGSTYVNLDRAQEIRDTGVDVEIFFDSGKATTLRGADAEKLRKHLDGIARDLNDVVV